MSKHYTNEFKAVMIKRMMAPNETAVSTLSKETGISESALYKWRLDYQTKGHVVPEASTDANHWTSHNKLAAVIETAAMNEAELGEYCRKKGLYTHQIKDWKVAALSGYQQMEQIKDSKRRTHQADQKKIKVLEGELRRKEKALAETAALLVLSKKWQAIWGENAVN